MARTLKSYSLTQRLSLIIIVATICLWAVSLICIYWEIERATNKIFDESLAETGHALLSTTVNSIEVAGTKQTFLEKVHSEHYSQIIFQLWHKDGHLIYRSVGVGTKPFLNQTGFGWIKLDEKLYRTYSVWDQTHTVEVQIAQIWQVNKLIQSSTIIFLFILSFIFLPLFGWLIYRIIQQNLASVRELSQHLAKRSSENLYPLHQSVPQEIEPIVRSLNTLIEEISESIEREKRFTSNAAHELRTPLASIRVHAQVLQHARSKVEIENAVTDIISGVDRASRMIFQLLTLARLSPNHVQEKIQLDLVDVINSTISSMLFKIQKSDVQLECELTSALVEGQPDQLEIMLRNLLDNAILYRRKDVASIIEIGCGVSEGKSYIKVEDNGIGIPAEKIPFVFQRFYRVNTVSDPIGSGLGLSIVKQIVELNHGEIEIHPSSYHHGCAVIVKFNTSII